ncbi:MAG: hypothetical protein CME59_22545 [Halioglobus sp.]|nr:hypothetical protein [Halioglobus sp.]|tara:strand:- start:4326 stop:4865 length:540 start_codon:yes stop_codon:yes gene_type:complete
MAVDTPYASLDHALRRAYSDPRVNYGKTLSDAAGAGQMTLLDQIAQDGLVRQVLDTNLNPGQRLILYLVYDTTRQKYNAMVALDAYTELFSERADRYFVLESIARWSYRQWPERDPLLPRKYLRSIDYWCERFHVKRWRLYEQRREIAAQLDDMFAAAQASASTVLGEKALIPGDGKCS